MTGIKTCTDPAIQFLVATMEKVSCRDFHKAVTTALRGMVTIYGKAK